MAKHKAKHKAKVLVNAKLDTNRTVTFTDFDFDPTGWDVKGNVTDGSTKPGEWKAIRLKKGDEAKELRLLADDAHQGADPGRGQAAGRRRPVDHPGKVGEGRDRHPDRGLRE